MRLSPVAIIRETKEAFNKIAPHFSDTRSFVWADLKPLAAYAKEKDRVLDIGCGNGRLYQLFKDASVFYAGIDYSEALIQIAKQKFPQTQFVVAEMRKLPFLDHEFNVIFCIAVFHHLPTPETRVQALREMKRVLKPGGKIILTNWNLLGDWAKKKYGEGDHANFVIPWKDAKRKIMAERFYHAFTPDEIALLCKKAGLKVEELYYTKKGERSDDRKGENLVTVISP